MLLGAPCQKYQDFAPRLRLFEFELVTRMTSSRTEPLQNRKGGEPVAFNGCAGFLHRAAGSMGVLMISPWGFEEFTIRSGWKKLAEMLAERGFPCLRFDLPGTGDSLEASDGVLLADWLGAVEDAARELRRLTNVSQLVILGQGLGALLAQEAADRLGAEALVLMAPMPEGRRGMRELELWGAMVAEGLRIPVELRGNEGLNVGGFTLSKGILDEMKRFKLTDAKTVSVRQALMLGRANRPTDAEVAAALRQRGIAVADAEFEGYDDFVAHLATPKEPLAAFERICGWLSETFPARAAYLTQEPAAPPLIFDSYDHYTEEAICFGPDKRLYGILCSRGTPRAVVVFANSGYNPHVGWARGHVQLARRLAMSDIATFRMDCGGLGDSDAASSGPEDVLYSADQIADVRAALDMLTARDMDKIVTAGRCSGAYIALHAAEDDARVSGVVSVNALRLIWRPNETLEQAMSGGSGSLANYGQRALSRETLMRLVTFQLPVWSLAKKVGAKVAGKILAKAAPLTGNLTQQGRLAGKVQQRFAAFEQRGVKTALLYADGDGGLDELAQYCGAGGGKLAGFGGISLKTVANADHNMTAAHAQTAIYDAILDVVNRLG